MHTKISVSLTDDTAGRLSRVCSYLNVSKSALVEQLLSGATADMCKVLDVMPPDPKNVTEDDLVRFRGGSVAAVQSRVNRLRKEIG